MHRHEHDENSAPNQAHDKKPTDMEAHLAIGVEGSQPPLEQKGVHDGKGEQAAAGFHSIYETAHHGLREMGVARSFQTLLKLNQKDGFDCPSCAWPDPDGHRKTAEFCENGAKAVASEATVKKLTPEIFAQHSISELLTHSDFSLEELGRITHVAAAFFTITSAESLIFMVFCRACRIRSRWAALGRPSSFPPCNSPMPRLRLTGRRVTLQLLV